MKKVRKRKMLIMLGVLLVIAGALVIWFNIPYSPVKKQFQNDIVVLLDENQLPVDHEQFTEKDFSQGRSGPTLTIDYTQYNFVNEPCRMAFIDSGMFGIPFEGYDYYQNGTGGMKGVIAKAVALFDQTGEEMDQACLATFLAESMFAPTILLQDYITFEEISDFEVQATIRYKGQTASWSR